MADSTPPPPPRTYTIDDDPMEVIRGEEGEGLLEVWLELLERRSQRSEFKVLDHAVFSDGSVSFSMDVHYMEKVE